MATTIPMPRLGRFRLHRVLRDLGSHLSRFARPVRAPLRNLASSPLTGIGFAAFDIGVFGWSARVGWMVTGVSLVILEHVIADEE